MGELAQKALRMIRDQGGQVVDHSLIERTLREIGKKYKPGLLAWIRLEHRPKWREMLHLEDEINQAALQGDQVALDKVLSEYRAFFKEMMDEYDWSKELPLFGKGDQR